MSELKNHIVEKSNEIFRKVQSFREHLHKHPELSYAEYNTMRFVAEQLESIGLTAKTEVAGTGVVAIVWDERPMPSECIALRADMDALPITEQNDVSYKSSIPGVMHACGHDVHTAILLGAAEILWSVRHKLSKPVKLIFQPGEEKNPGGASLMIKDGVLDNPRVSEIYALHVFPDLEVGNIGFKEGLYMASCDEIYITIIGKGGHGATPHQCIDPIVIGSQIVLQMQQLVSRFCDPKIPCVLSFGHFEALGATNVIPERAFLKGTFRTMNESWRAQALKIIEHQITNIVAGYGAQVEIEISKGYPYLENHPQPTRKLKQKSIDFLTANQVVDLPIRLTAEDFSFYAQEVPACFFRLGVRNEEKGIIHGVHHPKFDIDPEALRIGMQIMTLAGIDE